MGRSTWASSRGADLSGACDRARLAMGAPVTTAELLSLAKDGAVAAADLAMPGGGFIVATAFRVLGHVKSSEGRLAVAYQSLGSETAAREIVDEQLSRMVTEQRALLAHTAEKWNSRPADERPTESNVAAVLSEFRRVIAKEGDREKLELLKHALVHAFDPDWYAAGMTQALLQIVEELPVAALMELKLQHDAPSRTMQVYRTGSLVEHWFKRLVDAGLLQLRVTREPKGAADWELTDLGRRLIAFMAP